jgi:hypothetical protein
MILLGTKKFSLAITTAEAHPNRKRTETFEHSVMGKHHVLRMYCSQNKVKEEFLERWKDAWSKKEDRDDVEYPTHAIAIAEMAAMRIRILRRL